MGIILSAPVCCFSQQEVDEGTPEGHILGIIPNFRTTPKLKEYKPVAAAEKFRIAAQDSLDPGTIALAAAFAGESQLSRSDPSFGGGTRAYAHFWITAYGDCAIGNYMTEAIFPVLLHQDPRYFRRGSGSVRSRLGSAVGQIFVAHTDSGRRLFNYSEIGGNSAAVAISMAYYPGNRSASNAAGILAQQGTKAFDRERRRHTVTGSPAYASSHSNRRGFHPRIRFALAFDAPLSFVA